MPTNGYDTSSQALPYPEAEVEYQDHAVNNPLPVASSGTGGNTSSLYSFLSASASAFTNPTPSSASKKSLKDRSQMKLQQPAQQQEHASNDADGTLDDNSFMDHEYETSTKPIRNPFYRRRRFWWICALSTTILLAIFVPLLVIVILPKVAQAMINASTMEILQMKMTNPQERSVQVSADAAIVGIPSLFAATVVFQTPVQVFWVRGHDDQPRVGQMAFGTIEKKAFSKAQFTQETTLEIADPQLFGDFAKVMVGPRSVTVDRFHLVQD